LERQIYLLTRGREIALLDELLDFREQSRIRRRRGDSQANGQKLENS